MDDDGQFDYHTLTKMQIEYAIQHIDGSKYPQNLANARAALESRNSGASIEPTPLLSKEADARYTIWVERFLGILIGGYAILGLALDNVMIPYIRRRYGLVEIQFHGRAAWIAAGALIVLAAIPFFNGIDDSQGLVIKRSFRYIFFIAISLIVIALFVGPKIELYNLY